MPSICRSNPACGLLVVLLLVLLCSCAPLHEKPVGLQVDDEVGTALINDWSLESGQVFAMQGIARAKVVSPERNVSGTQVLLAERPDHFRAESLSPFGTPLLMLAANGDALGVLLPTQNVFYVGSATAENLGRFTRMPLKPVDLVDLLLYRVPLLAERVRETYALPGGGWLVALTANNRRQELIFGADRQLTDVRYLERNELFLKVGYSRFGELAAGFPARFEIDLPEFATNISLDFSELALNRTFLPGIFQLEPPAGAIVHELDAH